MYTNNIVLVLYVYIKYDSVFIMYESTFEVLSYDVVARYFHVLSKVQCTCTSVLFPEVSYCIILPDKYNKVVNLQYNYSYNYEYV